MRYGFSVQVFDWRSVRWASVGAPHPTLDAARDHAASLRRNGYTVKIVGRPA